MLGSGGVFVGLPTGSGKSLCFAALPFVFDILRARAGFVVVVVFPLQSILMEDQVSIELGPGFAGGFVSACKPLVDSSRAFSLEGPAGCRYASFQD